MEETILVVDDDRSLRMVLKEALSRSGRKMLIAQDATSALMILKNEKVDLIISDLVMPDMNGIELMEKVKKRSPDTGFLIITAYGTIEIAVDALHKGAFDFITKPFSINQIESRVERFFEFRRLKAENQRLRSKLAYEERFNRLVGNSKAMLNVFQQIEVVAKSDATVFIQGESGTGKELISQSIHENSARADKPFLKVNCSAIPETLFESTLFGHEKGAFTGAYKTHRGLFEEANGGTILMDEISEMPRTLQAKLLRVLQNRRIIRVGSTHEIPIDIRIIATSNRDMKQLIKTGQFRADLFFRLNVFPIYVPPLRSRIEDIPVLVDHFLKKFQQRYGYKTKTVSKEALDLLMRQNWPGNVRQLENVIERAVLYSRDSEVLEPEHFSLEFESQVPVESIMDDTVLPIAEMEKRLVYNALKRTNNNRTQAAKILGISVRTLRNKLHQYENEEKSMS